MSEAKEQWYASTSEEDWTLAAGPYDSAEAAIAGGPDEELEPGDTYYIGRKTPFEPTIEGSDLEDQLASRAWDHCGSPVGDWPNLTRAQCDDLGRHMTRALQDWLAAHRLEPQFFAVDRIEIHEWKSGEDRVKR